MPETLGTCNVLRPGNRHCLGELVVIGEVGDLIEARCDECGAEAAVPVAKLATEPKAEPWWQS